MPVPTPRYALPTLSLALVLALTSVASAQPAPTAPAAAPASPVSGIRNKLSAGDLPSAESMLEVHRERHGEDGVWLVGLSWLARGALLTGDHDRAAEHARRVRAEVGARRAAGRALASDRDLEVALGAALEVEAQLTARRRGAAAAGAQLERELAALPTDAPVALRSRLHKRLNMLTGVGRPAPSWAHEAPPGGVVPPTLDALRGRPVVLFLWAEWCGDCKAQAAALERVRRRHAASGLEVVALTRDYEPDSLRAAERARADSVWSTAYPGLEAVPRVVSSEAMVRYGGSSTPTFVFVDRAGVVRDYAPTRLTEAELERRVQRILR
jgi:thiol-disulfide isomerase/thioredoxin